MATMTVSLPDPLKEWIESPAITREYASSSDYVRDLVRRDKERRAQELSLAELRQIVTDARAGGLSGRSADEVFAEAKEIVRNRGVKRD